MPVNGCSFKNHELKGMKSQELLSTIRSKMLINK